MGARQLIANEVLAYLKHAINYMDDFSILQVCRSSFEEAEVSSARLLLYQTLSRVDQTSTSSRRKITFEGSLQDIITLMKETEPYHLSHFVAKDLCKVPPVTCNHVDLVKLLKDTTSLKESLAELHSKLEVSNNTISDLRAEVVLLRSAVTVNKSPEADVNVNTQCEAQSATTSRKSSASASPVETAREAPRPAASCASTPVEVQVRVDTLPPKRADADIAAASQSVPKKPQAAKTKKDQANQNQSESLKKDTSNDDGFIKVERKKKKPVSRNQCGTAPIVDRSVLRSETPATPLYVSRLHHTTTVQDVVDYIGKKTDWTLRVEKLESRYKMNFKSFVVRVPTHCLDTFLEQDFWPEGVVYRRFRGRLRDTSQLNTTPPIRVH